jgi:hypothetical protein
MDIDGLTLLSQLPMRFGRMYCHGFSCFFSLVEAKATFAGFRWGIPFGNHLGTDVTTLTDSPMKVDTPIPGPWKQVLVGASPRFSAYASHMIALSETGVLIGWGSRRSCGLGYALTGQIGPSILRWCANASSLYTSFFSRMTYFSF